MFKHPSHRQLKNRSLKRRVSSHQYKPEHSHTKNNDYEYFRANQQALNKLKRQPQLLTEILQNLQSKQQKTPDHPQLDQWQQLLESLQADSNGIQILTEKVMDCGEEAQQLRRYSVLDCLYD